MDSVRARLETWHLVVSEGDPEPESLFEIAEDACDRVAELETAIREIAEEERAFMSDPIGEAGVTHRKAAIARKLFYQAENRKLKKRIAELEGERDAYVHAALRNAIRWREACERFAPGDLPHERE